MRDGEIAKTKAFFWAANAYHDRAVRNTKEVKELSDKVTEMIGVEDRPGKTL